MKQSPILFLTIVVLLFGYRETKAATTLSAGDIAIVRENEDNAAEGFSFVTLVAIDAGTVIYFTDEGWAGTAWYGNSEGHFKYTAPALAAGSVVHIYEVSTNTPGVSGAGGTVAMAWSTTSFNFSGGESIIAYQTSASSKPTAAQLTFIAGIMLNDGASESETYDPSTLWTSSSITTSTGNTCQIPTGLTNGTNCFSMFAGGSEPTSTFNVRYNCTLTSGTKSELLAAINNKANWICQTSGGYATSDVCSFTVGSTSPEMNITGNSVSIADGDATPSTADYTDFGSTNVDGGTVVRTFTIQNTGTGVLTLTGSSPYITIGGTNSGDFSVTAIPSSSIAATTGTTTFSITFNPSGSGTRSATLSIANNDADENPYNFSIQGVGTAPEPEMSITGNSVEIVDGDATPSTSDYTDYGLADINTGTLTYTYTILNQGLAALSLSGSPIVSSSSGDFTVTQPSVSSIAASGSTTFQVTFNPTATGTRTATISIVNNDTNENPYNFTVQGYGTSQNLVAGDIAFIGFNSDDPDGFTFIALNDIPTTEMIYFTEEGWNSTAWAGSLSETHYAWQAPAGGLSIGSIVYIYESADNVLTASSGTISGMLSGSTFGFSGGDQVLAYQSGSGVKPASPTFIAGIHADYYSTNYNPTTTWSQSAISSEQNASTVPTGLTNGQDCISLYPTTTENDNAKYSGTLTGTSDAIRLAVNTYTNWSSKSDTYYDISSAGYAAPSITYSPEMNVQGNSTTITDGDVTPSSADYTDFSTANVTSGTVSRTFTIQNTGPGSLILSGTPKVAVSGTNAADFTVTTQPTSPVAVTTGTTTFIVQFDPSGIGTRTATISIANNDANENPYDFSIQGTGVIAPTVTTQAVSNILNTTSTGNGTITYLGSPNPTAYGVCWNTTGTPTISDSKTDNGAASATGAFTASMTSLTANTTYYVRAYATNTAGTSYGDQVSFTTLTSGTFTGSTNNDWATATNWAGGSVPTSATDVTIPSGKTAVIGATTSADCKNLTVTGSLIIQSSSSGTGSLIVNGASTGSVSCQRYMTNGKWHLITPTASGQSVADFLTANTNIPTSGSSRGMVDYNTPLNSWNTYYPTTSASGTMDAGKGYSARIATTDGTITFTESLTSGTKNVSLTTSGEGWNCVGNPYASAISMNTTAHTTNNFITVNSGNLDDSYACVYVWDEDATYTGQSFYKIICNSGFSTSKTILNQNYVAPGQGFFVKAKTSATNITFTSSMQSQQVSSIFRAPAVKTAKTSEIAKSWPGIILTATNSTTASSAVITFNEKMTNGLDVTYDAGLFRGTNGLSLYTRLVEDNGVDFAIQCLPENYTNLVVPVGIDCKDGGEITFSAQSVELPEDCSVILEDKTANTFTSLEGDATYKTTVAAGTTPVGRFYAHIGNTTTKLSGLTEGIVDLKAYIANGAIIIVGDVSDKATATLYDAEGRKLWVNRLQKGLVNTISCINLQKGIYVLTIQEKGKTVTRKLANK